MLGGFGCEMGAERRVKMVYGFYWVRSVFVNVVSFTTGR